MFTFAHNHKEIIVCTQNETCRSPKYIKNVQYRTASLPETAHSVLVKTRELTAEQISSVPCITCGAAVGEVCELHTGDPRTEPHRDRKLSAAEAVQKKSVKPRQALSLVSPTPAI